MPATIIDGNAIAREIKGRITDAVSELAAKGRVPCLAAVLIGDDEAAASYARSQAKHAAGVGIEFRLVKLAAETSMAEASAAIKALNNDRLVSGIMLHLPLPGQLDAFALQQAIAPAKDAEGVSPANLGLLAMGRDSLPPCTAAAALACLQSTGEPLEGREAVVVGRSVIVGKPLAMLLLAGHATVTQCHTRTRNLAAHTRRAEILCVAAGVADFIGAEHVSPGTIVIDVGTHRVPATEGASDPNRVHKQAAPSAAPLKTRTTGDVRFDEVAPIAKAITPVPGGVGPVTTAMLLANVVAGCRRSPLLGG